MDAQRWAVIESLYHAALAKKPGERSSYLAAACADDSTLRSEVESLLAHADVEPSGPAQPSKTATVPDENRETRTLDEVELVGTAEAGTSPALPATIGRYRILGRLGEGGMGVVYGAEQKQPRRIVALKVIKPGLATRDRLRRFELESQALARLQHPGIAQIYEAGTGDTGFGPQPFFAMEFIRGESLLRYAEAHQLNTRQRLELMAKVCEAVHHAHQRGIIHRDLKPGNILVDETGQPKVLDFGVARVTDSDAVATGQTDLGHLVGTLAYMSPEQALGDPLEVDTRSDVYALGVTVYELLAGCLPYSLSRQPHEAARTILEEDPRPLSSISPACRGDIETIVAKALEKDKAQRYASASGLAADIQSYLKDEPIAARPPSASYQLQKFARRNRALVIGAAAVFVALFIGIAASTWQAARAKRERDRATAAEQRATRERDRAFGLEHAATAAEARAVEQRNLAEEETRRTEEQRKIAVWEQRRAAEQSRIAMREQQRAEEQRREAEAQRDSNRRLLYIAEMNLAEQSWQSNAVKRAEELLLKYMPKPGEEDLRGLEWYYLWRLSHTERAMLRFHNGATGVAFSPDGRLLAVGHSGMVTLLDLLHGRVVFLHKAFVRNLAFTPDGRLLAGSDGKTVRLWDVRAWQELGSWPSNFIGSNSFSGDSHKLAIIDESNRARLLETSSGQELFASPAGYARTAALSPDGTRLAVAASTPRESIRILAVPDGREVLSVKDYDTQVNDLQFSPDGRILAFACLDHTARLWDAATGVELKTLQGHSQRLSQVRFSPDGQLLATTADDGTARLYQVSTGEEVATLKARGSANGVAFSPEGRLVAVAGDDGLHVWHVRPEAGVLKGRWAGIKGPALVFSPDGNVLFTARAGVRLWDVNAGSELPRMPEGGTTVALSADGRRLATSEPTRQHEVRVWDLPGRQKRLTLRHPADVMSMALSPDGGTLLTGQDDSVLRVWNTVTGQEVRAIQVHPDGRPPNTTLGPYGINGVVFSSDGKKFATAGGDGAAVIWDTATLKRLMTLRVQTWVFSVAFDREARRLATGNNDGSARIWDLASGRELVTLMGHGSFVSAVAFSPDGSRLLTGSGDTTVRIWQVPSGQEVMTLRGHSADVHSIAFSPQGDIFATASSDGSVRLWRVATQQTVAAWLSSPPAELEFKNPRLLPDLLAGLQSIREALLAPAGQPR